MTEVNFFDKFWKPYLEYEVLTSFSRNQLREEIKDLCICEGDIVANIGINWGDSIQLIFDKHPRVRQVYGVDSSVKMLNLAQAVFSDNDKLKKWCKDLSEESISFLKNLHKQAKHNSNKVTFIYSSAEDLYKQDISFDKIAATMGFHWLMEPQTKAFISMNKSLKLEGLLTFSTASSRYEVSNHQECFIFNPYYLMFFEIFARKYSKIISNESKKRDKIRKYSFDDVTIIIRNSGFDLENYREHRIEIPENLIDEVCIAGIKFLYGYDGRDSCISKIVDETFEEIKSHYDYNKFPAKYEVCPIFRIKKVKEFK